MSRSADQNEISSDGYTRFHDETGNIRRISGSTGVGKFILYLSFKMSLPFYAPNPCILLAATHHSAPDDMEFDAVFNQDLATNDVELTGLNQSTDNHHYWEMNYHESAVFLEVLYKWFIYAVFSQNY